MKLQLTLTKIKLIDLADWPQDDLDDLKVYLKKAGADEATTAETATPEELHDAVHEWLYDDIYGSLFDVNDVDENDFTIIVLDDQGNQVLPPAPKAQVEGE